MRSILRAIFAVVILAIAAAGITAQTDKRITDIRGRVAAINKAAVKYKKTKKDVFGISTEGAEATLYHSGNQLKKIVAKICGETFNAVSEFYFSGESLIFSYDRINRYDTQIGLNRKVKVVRVEQIRSYFDQGKMIRLLKGKKAIAPATEEFAEHEKDSQETVKSILAPEDDRAQPSMP
jgi:hypothetical protein